MTTIVTTTLEVPLLSDTDREVATSYARHAALSSGSLTVPLPAAAGAHGPAGVRAPVINVTVNTLNPTADVGAAIASALQQYKSQVGRSW